MHYHIGEARTLLACVGNVGYDRGEVLGVNSDRGDMFPNEARSRDQCVEVHTLLEGEYRVANQSW